MKLVLINGQSGTGKTAVATALKNEVSQSALIDADSLVAVNPLGLDEDTELMLTNAFSLMSNFLDAGYETIFTSGLTKNQKRLDRLMEKLDKDMEIFFVWLRASSQVRKVRKLERARDGADQEKHFEVIDQMYPDVEGFEVRGGLYMDIDTTTKTVEEVVHEIRSKAKI